MYQCPKCERLDRLRVVVEIWALLSQDRDGNFETETDGDHEWHSFSTMQCTYCHYIGPASRFELMANFGE
jgi:hypothetical protein